jgi:hypothetical protein
LELEFAHSWKNCLDTSRPRQSEWTWNRVLLQNIETEDTSIQTPLIFCHSVTETIRRNLCY